MPKKIDKKLDIRMYIDQAINILQHAAVGDFSKKLYIPKAENEFTDLFVAINIMIEDLKYAQEENIEKTENLKMIKDNLEDAIKEKTKNLVESEEELKRRLQEVEKINKLMIGRELKMIKLKEKIKSLEAKKSKK